MNARGAAPSERELQLGNWPNERVAMSRLKKGRAMISGTYTAKVDTPIGTKEGTLTLEEQAGVLSGTLHVLGGDTTIEQGKLEGSKVSFSGALEVPFIGKLPFTFEGEYANDSISGTASTRMGNIPISGSRVS